jgi:hypothetical protein
MSRLLAAAILLCIATSAGAISRHESLSLSCRQIHAIIATEGAAIFRYPSPRKPGLTLYDRYVSDNGLCARRQRTERVSIPAQGGSLCWVKRCRTQPDDCEGRGETCY